MTQQPLAVSAVVNRLEAPLVFGTNRSVGLVAVALALLAASMLATPLQAQGSLAPVDPQLLREAESAPGSNLSVIIRESDQSTSEAERLVSGLGGRVTRDLPIVGGFAARIPGRAIAVLRTSPSVARVWGDATISMSGSPTTAIYANASPDTVWQETVQLSSASPNGNGVTVALLDTGITQTADLGNRVLARVDLTPDRDGYDRFGHGTHMAGVIAGDGTLSGGQWEGIAPNANLVSVKVASADGSTDVSVVLAGLQWVVSNRTKYNIRVLNLSFGTDSRQSYLLDPLDYAVERAWLSGILVVVAAGNRGMDGSGTINKPGDDPFVITVGAVDTNNTARRLDDAVPPFSSRGPTVDGLVKPDLVAPGISIVSNRAPGSTIDRAYPEARLGDNYFKGTGTSQAAAVVSGVAAVLFQTNPTLSPDMVKAVLLRTADRKVTFNSPVGSGAGTVDANAALNQVEKGVAWLTPANQGVSLSTGLGSLEASRGSFHVYADLPGDGLGPNDADGLLDLVIGEMSVLGVAWNANSWSANSWSANSWSSCIWSAYMTESTGWSANSWSANSWSGTSWSANSWSGNSWSANSWSANSWSANSWS